MDKKKKIVKRIPVKSDTGTRIDLYLAKKIPEISRSQIQRLIKQDKISVDEKPVSKNYVVTQGQTIEIRDLELDDQDYDVEPEDLDIKVLFEDKNIIVISKPPGITAHPTSLSKKGSVVNALLYRFKKLSDPNGKNRAGIIHRLDKDTSGIMVIAKNNSSHEFISRQFAERRVKKTYRALVFGQFLENTGDIDLPIGRKRDSMKISVDKGKRAFTRFEVKESFSRCSYLSVIPKTGRTHQIRVHLSFIGHPILGDKKYSTKESSEISKELGIKRQFLHADSIEIINPTDNKVLKIFDGLTEDLKKILEVLRSKEGH